MESDCLRDLTGRTGASVFPGVAHFQGRTRCLFLLPGRAAGQALGRCCVSPPGGGRPTEKPRMCLFFQLVSSVQPLAPRQPELA